MPLAEGSSEKDSSAAKLLNQYHGVMAQVMERYRYVTPIVDVPLCAIRWSRKVLLGLCDFFCMAECNKMMMMMMMMESPVGTTYELRPSSVDCVSSCGM